MPWDNQRRTASSASGLSHRTKQRILDRDQRTCYVCRLPGADEVDHKVPRHLGGSNEDDNLGAIHSWPCHANKTGQEAARARGPRPSRKRPREKHPGLK